MAVQPGLCGTGSKTPKTVFLTTRLIFLKIWTLLDICFRYLLQSPSNFGKEIYHTLMLQKDAGRIVNSEEQSDLNLHSLPKPVCPKTGLLMYIKQYSEYPPKMTSQEFSVENHSNMSLVVRKPVFGVSDQVRHKPGCTVTEDG